MNLTIEQMREIVDGVPDQTATHINAYGRYICMISKHQMFEFSERLGWTHYHQRENITPLSLIKAAIADHDRTDYVSDIRNHIAPTTKVIEG